MSLGNKKFDQAFRLYEAGNYDSAFSICMSIIKMKPTDADAQQLAGIIEIERKNFNTAEKFLSKALRKQPKNHWIYSNLSYVQLKLRRPKDALTFALKAIGIDKNFPGEWNNLGNAYDALEKYDEAIEAFERANTLYGNDPNVLCNLGQVLEKTGRKNDAERIYEQASLIAPSMGRPYICLGELAYRSGKTKLAIKLFNKAVDCEPDSVDALISVAGVYTSLNRFEDAQTYYLKAINLSPAKTSVILGFTDWLRRQEKREVATELLENAIEIRQDVPEFYQLLAKLYAEGQRYRKALSFANKAVSLYKNNIQALVVLAEVQTAFSKYEDAECTYSKILKISPENTNALLSQAKLAENRNNLDSASELLEHVFEVDRENKSALLLRAKIERRKGALDSAIKTIDLTDVDQERNSQTSADLLFEKAQILDIQGRYEEAFGVLNEATTIRRQIRNTNFDKDFFLLEIERQIEFFSPSRAKSLLKTHIRSEIDTGPVFILGLPRSGTTLVEQILCSHPNIVAGDELGFIDDISQEAAKDLGVTRHYPYCLAAFDSTKEKSIKILDQWRAKYGNRVSELGLGLVDSKRFTDKFPLNLVHIPFIRMLFPEAPIIHVIRNPLDSGLSAMFANFAFGHEWANDMCDASYFIKGVYKLAQHYKEKLGYDFMQIRYEDLVVNQEKMSRKLIEYIDEDWDERIMNFEKTDRVSRTASYAQVGKKIYTSSVERNRNYEKFLEIPREILQPVMEHYGYVES